MKFTEENWSNCLNTLGFTEQENEFYGKIIYNEENSPCWTYCTKEEKKQLYVFLSGAAYWKNKCK